MIQHRGVLDGDLSGVESYIDDQIEKIDKGEYEQNQLDLLVDSFEPARINRSVSWSQHAELGLCYPLHNYWWLTAVV